MKTLIILVGPSGAGKSTITKMLEERMSIRECISTTSRKKRKGEINGLDYFFVDKEDIRKEDLIEFNIYAGNYYGLSKKSVKEALKYNNVATVVLEKEGAMQVLDYYKDDTSLMVIPIFLKINPELIKTRLKERGETQEVIDNRYNNAIKTKEFIAPDFIDKKYVVDAEKDIETVYSNVERIIKNL